MKSKKFPKEFLWGASTSAHQIEGNTKNDWTEWENIKGNIKTGEVSGKAANSWELFEKDADLISQMNLSAYRFSIEWSRIEPERGVFDSGALSHYRKILLNLRVRGITPVVTVHHFTNPLWLEDWSDNKVVDSYIKYVEHLANGLGDLVPYWITINEPSVYATMGYLKGVWPPGNKNIFKAYKAMSNMHKAHIKAYEILKKVYKDKNWVEPKVSMAFNLQAFILRSNDLLSKLVKNIANYITNNYSINRTKNHLDFIGVNHYFTHWIKGFNLGYVPDGITKNDLGWEIYPEGFYKVLVDLKKYNLPIMITENGTADAKDHIRKGYIHSYIEQMKKAIDAGVVVIGYLHWSLLDNWEWWDGYSGKFGLVETNFKTFNRKIRPSGIYYSNIAKNNELTRTIKGELIG